MMERSVSLYRRKYNETVDIADNFLRYKSLPASMMLLAKHTLLSSEARRIVGTLMVKADLIAAAFSFGTVSD